MSEVLTGNVKAAFAEVNRLRTEVAELRGALERVTAERDWHVKAGQDAAQAVVDENNALRGALEMARWAMTNAVRQTHGKRLSRLTLVRETLTAALMETSGTRVLGSPLPGDGTRGGWGRCDECGHIHVCEGKRCEGCKAPATKQDSEGIPLCQECFDELVAEAKSGTGTAKGEPR